MGTRSTLNLDRGKDDKKGDDFMVAALTNHLYEIEEKDSSAGGQAESALGPAKDGNEPLLKAQGSMEGFSADEKGRRNSQAKKGYK